MTDIYQLFPNSGATRRCNVCNESPCNCTALAKHFQEMSGPIRVPQPQKTEQVGYHKFKDEEGNEYGSFEVYFYTQEERGQSIKAYGDTIDHLEPGWYWVACFPGCMPDGEPSGPFYTSIEAYNDAIGE
jgi:hypothetical protein